MGESVPLTTSVCPAHTSSLLPEKHKEPQLFEPKLRPERPGNQPRHETHLVQRACWQQPDTWSQPSANERCDRISQATNHAETRLSARDYDPVQVSQITLDSPRGAQGEDTSRPPKDAGHHLVHQKRQQVHQRRFSRLSCFSEQPWRFQEVHIGPEP